MKKYYTTSSTMQLIKTLERAKGYDNAKVFDLNRAKFIENELIEALVRCAEAKEIETAWYDPTPRQEAKIKFIVNHKVLKYFLYESDYERIVRKLLRNNK